MRNGEVSYWWQARGVPPRRPSLPGGAQADVCIVGAGYTGLWTAYYLKRADPGLRIIVLEESFAGFGASGRNGGWVTAALPGSRARYAMHPRGARGVRDLERELRETSARPKASTPAWSRAARCPSPRPRRRTPGCGASSSTNGPGATDHWSFGISIRTNWPSGCR
jgi:hypothetical protein